MLAKAGVSAPHRATLHLPGHRRMGIERTETALTDYLAAMAVMKVNYDRRGHDVLQMLVPFVADSARRSRQALSDVSIQQDLQTTFGLPVPRTVIKTLIRRLTRAHALVREHGVIVAVRPEIDKPEYDLSADVSRVKSAQDTLLREGAAFASRVFNIEVSEQDLSAALLVLVRDEVAPLAVWAVNRIQPSFHSSVDEGLAHVVAQFVLHVVSEGSAESQGALEQIAKGSLLSGVLWSTDLEAPDRRISGLEIFLDTTLLLRLLGLCGPTRQAFSAELAQLATESGIDLVCFQHNFDEIHGVLAAAAAVLRSGRSKYYGEAVEFMVSEGWTASDVEEVISTLESRLNERGVSVRQKPDRVARYNMDEASLRSLLDANVHYSNVAALDADVDSLASIFTLRQARHPRRIEEAKAVFVTTNTNLAKGARQLYKIGEDLRGVPLSLIESQIASYLWARHSASATDLPLNLLTMGALSIAESEPKVWFKYVERLDELKARERVSERDYVLLRQSLLARSIILATTENDIDAFTEDTADFVLRHALAEHARALQSEVAEGQQELVNSQERANKAEAERDRQAQAQRAAYRSAANKTARAVVIVLGGVLALIALASAIISFPWPVETPLSATLPAGVSITLGVVAVAIGTASVVVGFTIRGVGQRAIDGLAGWLELRFRRWFAPVPAE